MKQLPRMYHLSTVILEYKRQVIVKVIWMAHTAQIGVFATLYTCKHMWQKVMCWGLSRQTDRQTAKLINWHSVVHNPKNQVSTHCSHQKMEETRTLLSITHSPTFPLTRQQQNTSLETTTSNTQPEKNCLSSTTQYCLGRSWIGTSSRTLNRKDNNFAGGTMEMNPVLPATVLEVVGSVLQYAISSPHTGSSHFLCHLSVEAEHYCAYLKENNTA